MNLSELASVLKVSCTENFDLQGVFIDSRKVQEGSLFVAIKGENFDGHDFIGQAVEKGAVAVVCERTSDEVPVPQLVVEDSVKELGEIASYHRNQFTCGVIALTGSNGKTTVKEMIASILPSPSFATQGNLNNHIGVPLSILNLRQDHRFGVFELGANHKGEIAYTVSMVKPKVTLINNIGPAHIEGFGSIEGVADAKGEIHLGLSKGGTAVVNEDDNFAHYWDACFRDKNQIRFSVEAPLDVYCKRLQMNPSGCASFTLVTPKGECEINLKVFGKHNVSNALAAAACTYALGIGLSDIERGLNNFTGVSGRMTKRIGRKGSIVIDDTYNANLRSVLSALYVLAKMKGHRILVQGDMGELGDATQAHHQEIGQRASELGIDEVYTCGNNSVFTAKGFGANAQHFVSQAELSKQLIERLDANTTVLVKGSRAAAMENIVHDLLEPEGMI
tara:strand:- start:4417 stop:5760 length:1344 start_codon:yes stop_codon:yes gene_type:complete